MSPIARIIPQANKISTLKHKVMEMENHPIPNRSEVTLGNWVITLIITMIPILNIVMLFIWSFSRNTNLIKAKWAQAMLILMAVWIILAMFFGSYLIHWLYSSCIQY